jgi:uncharacterized protein
MPVTPTYPGVYIEEIPSGVHTITGVATSIGAFIDYFSSGPLNTAVEVLSPGDFEREFGGLNNQSEASYAIQQFFLNGGSQAWVIRVGAETAGTEYTANIDMNDSGGNPVIRVRAGQLFKGTSVDNPGAWGNNLWIDVDYATSNPADPSLFNLFINEIVAQGGRFSTVQTETFRNLIMQAGASTNAIETVNEGSSFIQLSRPSAWAALPTAAPFPRPFITGAAGNVAVPLPAVPASGSQFNLRVDPGGVASGAWKTATITYTGTPDFPGLVPFLQSAIRAADPADPRLTGATVQIFGSGVVGNQYFYRILLGRSAPNFNPADTLEFQNVSVADTTADTLALTAHAVSQFYRLTNGQDPALPTATEIIGLRATKTGIYALEDVDLFNILCIPRAATLGDPGLGAIYAAAEAYCDEKRAFLIVDIPLSVVTLQGAKDWLDQHSTLRDANAAVYFPHPRIPDPLNSFRLRSVGASGTVAGLCARTDSNRGVWKAPAGIEATLRNVQELDYNMTDPENGVLNPLGLNCLRNFPVYGEVCWGARTLVGADQLASEWKYVPVRRLALYLEESLFRGTKWVVFEPNDEPLWAQIRLNVGAFMHNLFRQGAFQGQTPREAYFVKCDKETTTQNDIDLGIVNVVVGFAPLKPAEFVILKIQQIAGQIET